MVDSSSREPQPSELDPPGESPEELEEAAKSLSEQTPEERIPEEPIPKNEIKDVQLQEGLPFHNVSPPTEEDLVFPFEQVKEEPPRPVPSETLPVIAERIEKEEEEEKKGRAEEEGKENPEAEVLQETPAVLDAVPQLDASVFEEASRLIHEISTREEKREKESSSFPWIETFRNSVQTFRQEYPDAFAAWFRDPQNQQGLKDPFLSLLTILIHARFDQMDETDKAIENTQRVSPLLARPQMTLDEIPALEGTLFFSGAQWRDLFSRAIPKLQQVSHGILEKKEWKALAIERLIQVIPHVSERLSRKAVRRISELIPERVQIDFFNHPLLIDANLYRVASRLGIVDPHFDLYQGKNSMGDLKIQAFAKEVFPQDPSRVETPMAWMGRNGAGGHCLPSQPRCEGCLFEKFCQRLYLHFDPAEKGMGRH